MEKEAAYLTHWRNLLPGADDITSWGDDDFEKLSDGIFIKTNVRLSISTLKRLCGRVRYDSSPNASTLNALAVYAGFDNWRSYRRHIDQAGLPATRPVVPPKKYNMPALILATVSVLGVFTFLGMKRDTSYHYEFSSRLISTGLPNSVVFDYDAGRDKSNTVTIQQSWDPSRTENIPADGSQYTSLYYTPGYFDAKLLVNGRVEKETPVYIPSDGWVGVIQTKPVPVYLDKSEFLQRDAVTVTAGTISKLTGTATFNGQWSEFFNVKDFGLKGDDFTLETSLRNTSTPQQSSCRRIIVTILGRGNVIIVPLSDKGATAGINLYTGTQWIHGKNHDLSAFGCDFSQFQQLRFSVAGKKLSIHLNDRQIMTVPVSRTLGGIVGLTVSFEGAGEIRTLQLSGAGKTALTFPG